MADIEQAAGSTGSAESDSGGLEGAGAQAGPSAGEGGAAPARTLRKPPRTRTSVTFQALLAGVVVLVLLLIFILENTESVKIDYLGAKGHISLGIALLLAAAGGALLVAIAGTARIGQLRLHARRQRRRR
ncbi:MAG: lipopolysaccharide assembly protein LapA domain-containing protein [Solirubrobacteraceae bacterium]